MATNANVAGSSGSTPNSIVVSIRLNMTAAPSPIDGAGGDHARPRCQRPGGARLRMWRPGRAALRSRARAVERCTRARRRCRPSRAAARARRRSRRARARKRWRAVAPHATSSSVITFRMPTSCFLSIRPIAARIAGARAAPLPRSASDKQEHVVHRKLRDWDIHLEQIFGLVRTPFHLPRHPDDFPHDGLCLRRRTESAWRCVCQQAIGPADECGRTPR